MKRRTRISFNKKSQMGFLVTMILILFAAVILITAITQFGKKAGLEGALQACRFSVLAQSYTEAKPSMSGWKSPLDIECNTRYVTFKNTEVDVGFDPEAQKPLDVFYNDKKVKKFANLNEEIVNQVIAEEMRVCFYQFGEGQIDIFVNQEYLLKTAVCFVCSDITFDMKGKEYPGLLKFIDDTTIKSEGLTYRKYFDKAANESFHSWSNIAAAYPDTYNKVYSNKHYVVIFKKQYNKGAVLTGFQNSYFVHLLQADDLNKWCDLMAT